MTWHWWHITLSYAAVLGGFIALALLIAARARSAKKNLAGMERP